MTALEIVSATDRVRRAALGDGRYTAEAELADEFGRRHGWRWTYRYFDIAALRGESLASDAFGDQFHYPFGDHAFFYRFMNGWPASVACHLYDADPPRILAWAHAHGLQASFPADFPSWWFPGRTTLVVYWSAAGQIPAGDQS
jgi:hypothetical protein